VSDRRLVPYAVGLVGLLVLVSLAAGGRRLGIAGGGNGPSPGFFDYVWTTLVIGGALWIAFTLYVAWSSGASQPRPGGMRRTLSSALFFVAFVAAATFLVHHLELRAFRHQRATTATFAGTNGPAKTIPPNARTATFRWEEAAVVLGALAIVLLVVLARRGSGRPLLNLRLRTAAGAVLAALDEAVDDLRNEPDVRKAIIAAYARMEHALALHGLPRRRAEAPLEYLERALASLAASAGSIQRLTDLFEWAKFSHHDPEPGMKDEAIDALLAVRDELRNPLRADEAAA